MAKGNYQIECGGPPPLVISNICVFWCLNVSDRGWVFWDGFEHYIGSLWLYARSLVSLDRLLVATRGFSSSQLPGHLWRTGAAKNSSQTALEGLKTATERSDACVAGSSKTLLALGLLCARNSTDC